MADRPRPGALLVVIENEAAIREGMQVLLQGWGYVVLTAPSPEIAIGLLRRSRRRPAAVIADYHLDGCTGVDAIGHVRASFGTAIPAVVITADRTPEVQREVTAWACRCSTSRYARLSSDRSCPRCWSGRRLEAGHRLRRRPPGAPGPG